MTNSEITERVIQAAIRIHNALGPGLLESAYRECLFFELAEEGWLVEKEKALPIVYKGVKLEHGYRIDLLIDNKVVIEVKTVEALASVHYQQLLTYLKLGNYRTGLLINFHVNKIKDGLKRRFCKINCVTITIEPMLECG